ncbi:uncharacterized protein LOC111602075 isoform X3 [Drosophila hydei]|uniref:Uncharacterized protein LOC111602075 isoform X3 n=1 Tax=Drosophila hydei TaxID=7224 RepID=A0A6J1M4A0_DROHY|nr:uncharacterized protein LOC111602075 isoform X3 [Drosophila hydei]
MRIFGKMTHLLHISRCLSYHAPICRPHRLLHGSCKQWKKICSKCVCWQPTPSQLIELLPSVPTMIHVQLYSQRSSSVFTPQTSVDMLRKRISFSGTPSESEIGESTSNVVPVGIIMPEAKDGKQLKIVIVPLDLANQDIESLRNTLEALNQLRIHASEIDAFTNSMIEDLNNEEAAQSSIEQHQPAVIEEITDDKQKLSFFEGYVQGVKSAANESVAEAAKNAETAETTIAVGAAESAATEATVTTTETVATAAPTATAVTTETAETADASAGSVAVSATETKKVTAEVPIITSESQNAKSETATSEQVKNMASEAPKQAEIVQKESEAPCLITSKAIEETAPVSEMTETAETTSGLPATSAVPSHAADITPMTPLPYTPSIPSAPSQTPAAPITTPSTPQTMPQAMPLGDPKEPQISAKHETASKADSNEVASAENQVDQISIEVPDCLGQRLNDMAIASMHLSFEMDMTNVRDALINGELAQQPEPTLGKDAMVFLETKVEADPENQPQNTVPLRFNALIKGMVQIDADKLDPAHLSDEQLPEYNDTVTSIAASICSTALQRGFATEAMNAAEQQEQPPQDQLNQQQKQQQQQPTTQVDLPVNTDKLKDVVAPIHAGGKIATNAGRMALKRNQAMKHMKQSVTMSAVAEPNYEDKQTFVSPQLKDGCKNPIVKKKKKCPKKCPLIDDPCKEDKCKRPQPKKTQKKAENTTEITASAKKCSKDGKGGKKDKKDSKGDKKKDPCAKFKGGKGDKGGKKDSSKGGKDGKKKDPCAKKGAGDKDKKKDPCAKFKKSAQKGKKDADKKGGKKCDKKGAKGSKGGKGEKKKDPCAKFKKGGDKKGGKSDKKKDPCAKSKKGADKKGADKKGGKSDKKKDPCAKFKKGADKKGGKSDKKKDPCKKKYSTYASPYGSQFNFTRNPKRCMSSLTLNGPKTLTEKKTSKFLLKLRPHFKAYTSRVRSSYENKQAIISNCSLKKKANTSSKAPAKFRVYSTLVRRHYDGMPSTTQMSAWGITSQIVRNQIQRGYSKKSKKKKSKKEMDSKCIALKNKSKPLKRKDIKARTGLRTDCHNPNLDGCPKKFCSGVCGKVKTPRKKCARDNKQPASPKMPKKPKKKLPAICMVGKKTKKGKERNKLLAPGVIINNQMRMLSNKAYTKRCICQAQEAQITVEEGADDDSNTMEVVRIPASYQISRERQPQPDVRPFDVLIDTGSIALTGSDIHVYENANKNMEGMTLGHDATGFVEKVGSCVKHLHVGDRVVIESALSCGICDYCKRGLYNICADLMYNGFLATHQTHPADLCHRLPDSISLEEGTLTQTLAMGCQACFKAEVSPTSNILIIGSSPTAVAAAMCAKAIGAQKVPNGFTTN